MPQISTSDVDHTIGAHRQMPPSWRGALPTDQQISDETSGNICRCGTHQSIRQAIESALGPV
ncbi:MAG: hypothetical protein J2P48_02420 [Alphaproteobacteria bacterium]|nr:hypothetical protein [Alphaproteobacteria bacterium]